MSKVVFRLGTSVPQTELMDVGEPLWDVDNAKLGINNGEQQPRWYPRLDINNNIVLNPGTGIYSSTYSNSNPKSYVTFDDYKFKMFSNGKEIASFHDTAAKLHSILVAEAGISSTGVISFPGFTIDPVTGNVTINGNLVISGTMNLSLSQFAQSVLPTLFSNGQILVAGSPHSWQDPATLFNNTAFALNALRTGNNPESFKMDTINNNYLLVNPNTTTAFIARRITDFFANSAISYARGTTATYYDKHGILLKAAINTPREDHDPFTGEKMGILLEGGSTNLIYNSTDPSIWSVTNAVFATCVNSVINTYWTNKGFATPNELTESTANGNHNAYNVYQNASETLPLTFSFYVQADPYSTRNTFALTLENISASNSFGSYFNLNSMTAGVALTTGSGNLLRTSVRQITDSIYRVSITGTLNASNGALSAPARVRISGVGNNNLVYTGVLNGGVLICTGFQLEIYDKSTSYIPTNGVVASRNPDLLSLNLTAIDFDSSIGTIKLGIKTRNFASIGTPIFNLQSTTDPTSFHNLSLNSSYIPELVAQNSNLVLYDVVIGALTPYLTSTIIYNFRNNGKITISQNGAATTVVNTGTEPSSINQLNIGKKAGSNQFLDGWINFLSYSTKILTQ